MKLLIKKRCDESFSSFALYKSLYGKLQIDINTDMIYVNNFGNIQLKKDYKRKKLKINN